MNKEKLTPEQIKELINLAHNKADIQGSKWQEGSCLTFPAWDVHVRALFWQSEDRTIFACVFIAVASYVDNNGDFIGDEDECEKYENEIGPLEKLSDFWFDQDWCTIKFSVENGNYLTEFIQDPYDPKDGILIWRSQNRPDWLEDKLDIPMLIDAVAHLAIK